jgi:hypothetical protein
MVGLMWLIGQGQNMWVSGFLTVGSEEGRSFFRNVVFLVFLILAVTIEEVLK